jgi:transposase
MMAGISADLSARGVQTVIAIEACGASHHWARLLQPFDHEVKLIAPQPVNPCQQGKTMLPRPKRFARR